MATYKDVVTRWLIPLLGAIAVGGFFLYWQWPLQQNARDHGSDDHLLASADGLSSTDIADLYSREGEVADATASDQLPATPARQSSADFVQLRASREGGGIRIELAIEKHWHINANPASYDSLIPTQVRISDQGAPISIRLNYPEGHPISVGLDEPIQVYSGQIDLVANLPEQNGGGPFQVEAQVQACNDSGLCLPPSMLSTRLER